jgi:hypothetical protein
MADLPASVFQPGSIYRRSRKELPVGVRQEPITYWALRMPGQPGEEPGRAVSVGRSRVGVWVAPLARHLIITREGIGNVVAIDSHKEDPANDASGCDPSRCASYLIDVATGRMIVNRDSTAPRGLYLDPAQGPGGNPDADNALRDQAVWMAQQVAEAGPDNWPMHPDFHPERYAAFVEMALSHSVDPGVLVAVEAERARPAD